MTVEVPGDRPGGLAFLQPPATLRLLMLGQLGLAAKLDTARPGCLPTILRPLYDPLALILSEGAPGSDALNDLDAIEHRSRRPIRFR